MLSLDQGRPRRRARAAALGVLLSAAAAWGQSIDVPVVQPERRAMARVSSQPATAEALHEADLGSKVSGEVTELDVDIGSRVKAGQVLARMAVPELIQARNAAAAQVAALRSAYERTAALAERNSVTQKSLAEAKARLDGAIAAEAEAQAQMGYATIQAPFDGVVTLRAIDRGDMVYQAGSPKGSGQPLLRIAQVDVIRVKTYVPERDSIWVDAGDPATVAFEALPGTTFQGKVARLSGALDPATRTMLVEIDLPNADGRIRPGFYGRTEIALERREGALALPSDAVRTDGGNAYVYVVGADDTVRRTAVSIGLQDAGWVEIAGGLTGNERVVAGAAARLADGAAVRAVTAGNAAR
ncbi:MAG TPA: efflux RND transporter periplasmic adaptor subunit [Gammaproteobacteria bacterium]|nr:efflux RND transporter periplasmic adaptor subunit [Gammaproteobacteria bacterium]